MKIFVIGSYFGETADEIQRNINKAQLVGIELLKKGHVPLVPQSMYAWWDHALSKEEILKACFSWMDSCDAVFVLNIGPEGSNTARAVDMAQDRGIAIFTHLTEVPDLTPPPKPNRPTLW